MTARAALHIISGCNSAAMLPHLAAALLWAATAQTAAGQDAAPPEEFAVTRHELDLEGRRLGYAAHAGTLPIRDSDTGDLMARMFITAYRAETGEGGPPRPVTFIWNGGPGANSSQTHLAGYGPMGLDTPDTYPEWTASPPARIAQRPESWLAVSDLVFVDPVGSGYSRAASPEHLELFHTTRGDIEAVAEMIRLYRIRFDAWDQPLFIAGESYGAARAMGVAEALERRRAGLAGVVLISGSYNAGQDVPAPIGAALQTPMLTAAAHFHGRLSSDLQSLPQAEAVAAAESWARRDYAEALAQGSDLSADRRAEIVAGLARFTGLEPRFIDADRLTVSTGDFADRLLDDLDLELGRYDYRMTASRRDLRYGWSPVRDPSLTPMLDMMQGTFAPMIRYFRHGLEYRSDLLYRGPFGEGFHPLPLRDVTEGAFGEYSAVYSDWTTVRWNRDAEEPAEDGAAPGASAKPPLQRAMEMNPRLLVWNIVGMYDISCQARLEAVARTPEVLRPRVRTSCYEAGHMVYTDPAVRREMARDFTDFVEDALALRASAP